MTKRALIHPIWVIFLFSPLFYGFVFGETKPFGFAIPFPDLTFTQTLSVDKAFEFLRTLGYKNLIVNAGGDLRVGGSKFDQPWLIGIQDPRASQKIMARISVSETAIATSGDYEKFFIYQG
jgi:hypothetical protein